jgi:hypothetical protein
MLIGGAWMLIPENAVEPPDIKDGADALARSPALKSIIGCELNRFAFGCDGVYVTGFAAARDTSVYELIVATGLFLKK